MNLLEWKLLYFDSNVTDILSRGNMNKTSELVQIMAWHWTGEEPLSESMMSWHKYSHLARPRWVNTFLIWRNLLKKPNKPITQYISITASKERVITKNRDYVYGIGQCKVLNIKRYCSVKHNWKDNYKQNLDHVQNIKQTNNRHQARVTW